VRQIAPTVPLLALAVLAASCASPTPDEVHVRRISAERALKNEFFASAPDSPMPAPVRDQYLPLSYYDIDLTYAVPAQLRMADARVPVVMPTSTGRLREMERIGTLEFTLKGQPLQLAAFVDAGTTRVTRLFVPFADQTSGAETYSAGRYMDLDPEPTGIYIVDFNVAYHPYCYFNAEYDCPFPPPENRLPVPVRAGERLGAPEAELDVP
jgi:uncharacterized protein (DUF1684 family)